ncbi:MAG: hypothetical protein KF862_07480 [Chitinophagaceae bacterium]|nr:hypothetical protein [Chitinophagaceae bacterium]
MEQLVTIHIGYACYRSLENWNPEIRFNLLEEAQAELTNSDDIRFIVTEVSEDQPDGKRLIKQERIAQAPQEWIPAKFIPEYDGWYLVYTQRKTECGNTISSQRVVYYDYTGWRISKDETVSHWMIIKPPKIN